MGARIAVLDANVLYGIESTVSPCGPGMADRCGAVAGSLRSMASVKRAYGPGEATALVAGGGPPTDDDVSITNDGRRLDSAEAVLAFVEELRREQEALERSA